MSLLEQVNLIGSSAWSTQRRRRLAGAKVQRAVQMVIAQPLALLVPAISIAHHHEVT